jgi:hypothetical protein
MTRARPRVPADVRRQLTIETGGKCSMPRCGNEVGLETHHIDGDPSNNAFGNLLWLCGHHHNQASYGTLDRKLCQMLKDLLRLPDLGHEQAVVQLRSRREYMEAAVAVVAVEPTEYRECVVGPMFLHPKWYTERRNRATQHPDFDSARLAYITATCGARNHSVRLVLRNAPRYREKVEVFVKPGERDAFVADLLHAMDAVWGQARDRGPDLCCLDIGIFRLDIIGEQMMIVAQRASLKSPVSGGWLYTSLVDIDRERAAFDMVFDTSSRGQSAELQALEEFVRALWK